MVAIPEDVFFLNLKLFSGNMGCFIKFPDGNKVHFSIRFQLPVNQVVHGCNITILIKLDFISECVLELNKLYEMQ